MILAPYVEGLSRVVVRNACPITSGCGIWLWLMAHPSHVTTSSGGAGKQQERARPHDYFQVTLPALVYDILPSTTAVFSYAIGSRKLSANEQFFVGAQTVVSLLQTTQIISDFFKFYFYLLLLFL